MSEPPTSTSAPGIAGLHPAYFALVMATGIVSIAAQLTGHAAIAMVLFVLNACFYVLLWGLNAVRLVRFPREVKKDLLHHGRSVGFFTVVPATCVLGSQAFVVVSSRTAALALWIAGIALWAAITYGIFTILTVKREKPSLSEGIHGGWLLCVVAAQSVSVLGAQLAPALGASAAPALLFSTVMWLGGGMLYVWIIGLIFYRYGFFVMSPSDLAPPYWINMGAAAISTLAGAILARAASLSPVLTEILPFVRGCTLMWWATATWWIPMLLILGFWRHVVRGFPLRYDPLYWGAVFPLGMYTVCTLRLSSAIDAPYLAPISYAFVFVALAAWSLVAIGMCVDVGRRLASKRGSSA